MVLNTVTPVHSATYVGICLFPCDAKVFIVKSSLTLKLP